MTIKVLVSVVSKHGSTAEIASFIGNTVARRDLDATNKRKTQATAWVFRWW